MVDSLAPTIDGELDTTGISTGIVGDNETAPGDETFNTDGLDPAEVSIGVSPIHGLMGWGDEGVSTVLRVMVVVVLDCRLGAWADLGWGFIGAFCGLAGPVQSPRSWVV